MELKLVQTSIPALETDALVLFETEGGRRADLAKPLAGLYESGEIGGKFLEFTLLHGVDGFAARRVLVAGSGKPEKLDAAGVLKLAAAAIRFLKGKGVKSVAFAPEAAFVSVIAEGVLTGAWDSLVSSKPRPDGPPPTVGSAPSQSTSARGRHGLEPPVEVESSAGVVAELIGA